MSDPMSQRWRSARLAWCANLLLGIAIATGYVEAEAVGGSVRAWVFVWAALVSSVAVLSLAPAILVGALALVCRHARTLAWSQAALWTLFQLLLFADTRIYSLFRYHFNGMVWNVITTPGAEDAVELGVPTWIAVGVAGALLWVGEERLWTRVLAPCSGGAHTDRRRRVSARVWRATWIAAVGAVLIDKGLYAVADIRRDSRIVTLARTFPGYQRLTVKRLAERVFHVKLAERAKVELADGDRSLRYPRAEVRIDPAGARPNILIVVIDSLRADMLDPQTMPEVSRYAATARRFENHISGGNATRFGIFSLVYGIHGSYWMPVYEEHAPPVLISTLARAGYDMRVLSAASMNFPEFRSTAWVAIEDRVEDHMPSETKHERDSLVAERFESWMNERAARKASEPFFCFVLLDSAHGSHSFPLDQTPFQPFAPRIDWLKLSGSPSDEDLRLAFNSYKNAVHHADHVTGRMLTALAEHSALEHTLVVVTGDHGEEFREHGYYGHTSNYTPEQVHVTFVLGGPGVPAGTETRPTSHLDLVPTLLERLGADRSQRRDYTFGESLFDPPSARQRVISGWEEIAVWVDDGVLFVPLEGRKGGVEAYGFDWKRIDDEERWIENHAGAIGEMARQCRWFLR